MIPGRETARKEKKATKSTVNRNEMDFLRRQRYTKYTLLINQLTFFHYHTYEEITDYGASDIDLHNVVCAESRYR